MLISQEKKFSNSFLKWLFTGEVVEFARVKVLDFLLQAWQVNRVSFLEELFHEVRCVCVFQRSVGSGASRGSGAGCRKALI